MKTKQHVQLPNKQKDELITPQDQLVYVSIKRHMNKDTKEAFPSIDTLKKHTGLSKPTILKCINNLESCGYLNIKKEKGKPNIYTFPKYDKFSVFGYDFLDNESLSSLEKQYILSAQQYMYLHSESKTGITTYSNKELSSLTGLSLSSINRCNKTLQQNKCLDIIKTKARELEFGVKKDAKIFHMDSIGNEVIFTLLNHEDRISNNEQKLYELQNQIKNLTKLLEQVLEENRQLKKEKYTEPQIILD